MNATILHLPRSTDLYEAALEGLARMNTWIYEQDPLLPEIHAAGVKYRREAGEAWRHVGDVVGQGWGDCEDLASARVGWLRAKKIDPKARVKIVRTGPRMTHAIVERGNGKLEDPSRDLGMGTPEGNITMHPLDGDDVGFSWSSLKSGIKTAAKYGTPAGLTYTTVQKLRGKKKPKPKAKAKPPITAQRIEKAVAQVEAEMTNTTPEEGEIVRDPLGRTRVMDENDERSQTEYGEDWEEIGADPSATAELTFTATKTDNGYQGIVRIPLDAGRALFVSRGGAKTKEDAVKKTASVASKVINNPAVAALIPPQAKFALNIVQSKAARDVAKKLLKLF